MYQLTRYSLEHPRLTTALIAVITLALASQLLFLRAETGYRAYLGEYHPTIEKLESFIDGFGGGLPMAAVWSCADTDQCESVFDDNALFMASDIVGQLRRRNDVRRIESPATTPILIARGDEIGARTLVVDDHVSPDIELLRTRAVIDPVWRRDYSRTRIIKQR